MVKEVAGMCLLPAVENRDPLETKFAEAVGETLDAAMEGLAKAHTDALETKFAEAVGETLDA